MNVYIAGTGRCTPDNTVTNEQISKLVDTSDEWIVKRTGIKKRYISSGEKNYELAKIASLKAIADAHISPDDIDLIIVATISPDYMTPSTACILQKELGATRAFAFDISAACSGFVYALNIASQFIQNNSCKCALIVGSEIISKILDWQDRTTCVLFGDGAGAAILKKSEREGINYIKTGSIGDKWNNLKCPYKPVDNPFIEKVFHEKQFLTMDGKEIFKFATKIIVKSIKDIQKVCDIERIKYIVPHQANVRIIETACKNLNLDMNKFYLNLDSYGNTSGASIPIALDELNRNGKLKKGDKLFLTAFGAGLTYGWALINWLKN